MEMTTSLHQLDEHKGQRFLLVINGIEAGTISKGNNTSTTKYPWKAWFFTGKAPDANQPKGFTYEFEFLGSFYGRNGKADAIKALQIAHQDVDKNALLPFDGIDS